MPGSAPTVVPMMTPMAQKSKLMGVNATASPWSINRIVSTKSPPERLHRTSSQAKMPAGRGTPKMNWKIVHVVRLISSPTRMDFPQG